MSSTKDDKIRDAAGALFDGVLAPMAESMRASGDCPFPLKPDASRDSYYVRRAKHAMTHGYFTAPSCADFDDFERRLAGYWEALGRHELASKVSHFAATARAVYALGEQDAEVSPFVYVMF